MQNKRPSSNVLDWYPGKLNRSLTGGSSTLKIQFSFPADSSRGSPTRESHFDLPATYQPGFRPGTHVLIQATLKTTKTGLGGHTPTCDE